MELPLRVVVGPLPGKTVAQRDDDLAWLAMVVVTAPNGDELIADIEAAPTLEGAASKAEGLLATWAGGLAPEEAMQDVMKFLDEHGWKEN